MKVLFTSGGTGGHIYPAVAVAQKILERQPQTEVLFVSGKRDIERKIIHDAGFTMKTLPVTGMPRSLSPVLVPFCINLGVSLVKSAGIIRKFKPSVIMATGGYVSGPPILAGWALGVPIVMQEQNSYPGFTTRKLARFAKIVFLGFRDAENHLGKNVMTIVTGNPVRESIGLEKRENAASEFGIDPDTRTLLVFGGSQGARAINEAFAGIAEAVAEQGIQALWQTGRTEYDKWKRFHTGSPGGIKVFDYISEMSKVYAVADLVVSRAGAMTIAEITACGLPGIFVPLPTAAENHQEFNARSLVQTGAAVMILEKELTPAKLKNEIFDILSIENTLTALSHESKKFGKKDAAEVIAEKIIERFGMN